MYLNHEPQFVISWIRSRVATIDFGREKNKVLEARPHFFWARFSKFPKLFIFLVAFFIFFYLFIYFIFFRGPEK